METAESLSGLIAQVIKSAPERIRRTVESSREIVVFGSSACGLRAKASDLDLLCVGGPRFHFRNRAIDMLALSDADVTTKEWLNSEIASHICSYGVWIKTGFEWAQMVRLNGTAAQLKRRRLDSFARSFQFHWFKLSDTFKKKYITKLRRETHRLILLQSGVPIPPTRILDWQWRKNVELGDMICSTLFEFLDRSGAESIQDFRCRIENEREGGPRLDLTSDLRVSEFIATHDLNS